LCRRIISYQPDPTEADAWIAELECGHTQHVRHQPPFQERPWVLTEEGRAAFIGIRVECPLCDAGRAQVDAGTNPR
jgi:hypothetical protein